MGNHISCTLLGPAGRRPTKVILPSGEIRLVDEATKAGELMLEAPNSFIVDTKSMQIGRRFAALNADEDLEMGSVFAFFPMSRLNSAVKAADMAVLFMSANSVSKRRGGGRISPDERPRVSLDEYSTAEFEHRMSVTRSKKPLLDTIVEEPVCIRLFNST